MRLRPGLLPIIFLVVVVAWALFAVAMLTGTLVSAQQIENRVGAINATYPEVGQNLKSLPLAFETGRIAEEIDRVTKPVGPQFTQIVQTAGQIETSAKEIEGKVTTINTSVKSIGDQVGKISAAAATIGTTLTAVGDRVGSINNSATGIGNSFVDILSRARSIDVEVKDINERAIRITDIARDIKDDLDEVRSPLVPDINQNARAISNSPVINPLGRGNNPLMTGLQSPLLLRALKGPVNAVPAPPLQGPPLDKVPGLNKVPQPLSLVGDSKNSNRGPRLSPRKSDGPLSSLGGGLGGLGG